MSLKQRTANTLKWNLIDRLLQQVLYAVTGIVLARMLTPADFGLVGAVLIFQAFASLLVDSGFSYALIQRKQPTQTDYSTVLWFNMLVAFGLYGLLWLCAPLIADCFHDDRLVGLSRVMFLAIPLNASAIVQTNRLMKQMNVRMVAVSNALGLTAGAVVGIWLALNQFGAWAIVWQTLMSAAVKSLILWVSCGWKPSAVLSRAALSSFFGIGGRMMFTSFLNTVFQNIYSFFIGSFVSLGSLGYYTQSDKWSKMGITSITQTITASFLPALSAVQDEPERFGRVASKMNRFTGYLLFPALIWLMVMAAPLFHLLFGTKWDASIILFQLLLVRGIFTALNSLYNNYMLALGHAKPIMWLEVLRDSVAVVALAITFPYMSLTTPDDAVYGITILLWGQVAASVVTYVATLVVTCRRVGASVGGYLLDLLPYVVMSCGIAGVMWWLGLQFEAPLLQLLVEGLSGLGMYLGVNAMLRSRIQADVLGYFRH